ncbi:hypothetical protein K688_1644 [Campylobacter jejuni HB-CJGB-LXC]|uniref:Uncharacterized protein n=1 Tax=Campylobacter jejuni subsp. jejuni serotype O:23/36 (strain 81-176) TaxID=354242 RepID=A0A0H3PAW1_CAMJJ|nr:hypothetical protein CJE0492 [Campylobacter jejuni RM1221]ADT72192.1 hypothetical protein CJS3_0430 [Campylobacter jejuni subsp. jejuni S3]ALF91485.1 hypothetical protein CjjRM3197_0427 [Campylobacter jejuni subsp. jejuni]AOW96799.1 hypothetical protein CjjRM3420_0417 [Campylobacter jejuni subsp. jejuni str. RM3420]APA78902.1 hypothetical protein CJM129_2085 [Campylobacter jejuni subsp. jejuni M129]ASI86993.1 hypothetical protein FORC46_0431 [Campylobacter jejuni]EAQ58709.1 hypothetical pr
MIKLEKSIIFPLCFNILFSSIMKNYKYFKLFIVKYALF